MLTAFGVRCWFSLWALVLQALDRAGGKAGNKGYEAAVTAIETANVLKSLAQQGFVAPAGVATPGSSL